MAATAEAPSFPILAKYQETLSSFQRLTRVARDSSFFPWEDQLGRLRVFAGNVKVHRRLRNSLDFKLRDSSHLSTVVLKLLGGLSDILARCTSLYLRGNSTTTVEDIVKREDDDDLRGAFEEVTEAIDNLNGFVPTLLAPASHDRVVDDLGSSLPQTAKDIDIRHVQDKFPAASKVLAERLGAANWKRRIWLAHSQARHAAKVKRLQESELQARRNVDSTYGSRPAMSTTRSQFPSTLPTSTLDAAANHGDGDSDSGISDGSATSYNVTVSEKDPNGPIRVPKPPEEYYEEKPKHVMEDLSPYICSFEGCLQAGTRFTRRRDWFKHELEVHRSFWVCSYTDCREELSTADLLEQHMIISHKGTFGKKQLRAITFMCKPSHPSSMECPLCLKSFATVDTFRRHLGGEMEELALFVLPRTQPLDDDFDSDNEWDDDSNASSSSQQEPMVDSLEGVRASLGENSFPNFSAAGQFAVGDEVFYRPLSYHPMKEGEGEGFQCVIRRISSNANRLVYELEDIDPDYPPKFPQAEATELIPISKTGVGLAIFNVGTTVLARYPDTTHLFGAEVMSYQDGIYALRFEGDERKRVEVEERFVVAEVGPPDVRREVFSEVHEKEIQDEKERKKDIQRKRRREYAIKLETQKMEEAEEKAQNAPDEKEKYLREVEKSQKKIKQIQAMINQDNGPDEIHELQPLVPNLEGGTTSSFHITTPASPEPAKKKTKKQAGPVTRPKKSKEKKQAEKDAAEAAYAAMEKEALVRIAPKELPRKEAIKREDRKEYCFCHTVTYGNMIGCENDQCPYEWFHFKCVGLKKPPPESALWHCPECRTKPGMAMKMK